MSISSKLRYHLKIHNQLVREMLAEFLGTFVLGAFAFGWDAAAVLKGNTNHNISVGIGLCTAIYVAGQVSGGHINPTVTLGCCLAGRTKLRKFIPYSFAQTLGGLCIAALQYGLLYDVINHYSSGSSLQGIDSKSRIFATFPSEDISLRSAMMNQVIGGFLLVIGILAITDNENVHANPGVAPIGVGFLVTGVIASFSLNQFALNPALDIPGRVMLSITGGGVEPFSYRGYTWFCIPIFFPLMGSMLAALFYKVFISFHRPEVISITPENTGRRVATLNTDDTKF